MKILTKLALTAVLLATATAAHAEWVSGYFRSSGTYVAPHYRTPANGLVYDNLSYQPTTPRFSSPTYRPSYSSSYTSYSGSDSLYGSSMQVGDFTFHNYYSTSGRMISGTTTTIGNMSFTTLNEW